MHETVLEQSKLINRVSRTWAAALHELADSPEHAAELGEALDQLVQLSRQDDHLRGLFESLAISRDQRAASLDKIFKGRVDDLLYNFLGVLNRHGRLHQLRAIAVAYQKMLRDFRGERDVWLTTATQLDEDQQNRIAQALAENLEAKPMLHTAIDPALIGGLKVRIGDRQIDASVAAQLERIEVKLVEAGRAAARRQMNTSNE